MPLIGKKANVLRPFWSTNDGQTVRLYLGHVTDVLDKLPAKSVHCCVTSPPYWGLRDYGTGTWEGGDEACSHKVRPEGSGLASSMLGGKPRNGQGHQQETYLGGVCKQCGAKRIDQQLGSEPSPDCGTHGQAQCGGCFVCSMVAVFRGVRRVLRDEGTCWLNLGDTYGTGKCGGGSVFENGSTDGTKKGLGLDKTLAGRESMKTRTSVMSIPSGNLVGVPWRVALALQADGWVLRQDIIWAKPSPMPESCTNRCTKSHEYIFLLTKSARYYYDNEAIKEKQVCSKEVAEGKYNKKPHKGQSDPGGKRETTAGFTNAKFDPSGRNKRSVWTVSSESYPGAHYATFPKKLITPCIKAGTSERGCCARCGSPWKRVVECTALTRDRPNKYVKRNGAEGTGNSCANTVAGVDVKTIGWYPTCRCDGLPMIPPVPKPPVGEHWSAGDPEYEEWLSVARDLCAVSSYIITSTCTVLDPFIGSGTTAVVSVDLGRLCVGIDLSEDYLRNNAMVRIEGDLLGRPALRHLIGKAIKPVEGGRSLLR